jgi:hypothetical protein
MSPLRVFSARAITCKQLLGYCFQEGKQVGQISVAHLPTRHIIAQLIPIGMLAFDNGRAKILQ